MSDYWEQRGSQVGKPDDGSFTDVQIHDIGSTKVELVDARSILTKASGFMKEYDFTLNPYSGCSFGCTYCYAAFFHVIKNYKTVGANG